ncbi:MAG: UxaA family hydrolase [Rhizobiales bacterium]|nr:UxaA family hydrolase [Hyphomicrobiales bacterium]NRB12772.1 UxaA family hydrolase [Hyphomicrobiales bacterium]
MPNLTASNTDKRLMLLDDDDNILMVIQPLKKDEEIWLGQVKIKLEQDVKVGFKLARKSIDKGAEILKYGYVIGVAVNAIRQGEIIHFHNIASTYMPSVLKTEQLEDK